MTNTGSIVAPEGSVLAGAGNRVTLDLGGPIKIKVEEGVLDALIEQGGAIRADGGLVYLTAKAVGEVTSTVINHTGITEAKTLAAGKNGKIYLMGGMQKDRIVVGGKLDASAPNGGDGGFIETSAAKVKVSDDARVTTAAPKGKTGSWLIDPSNFTITSGKSGSVDSGVASGSSIGATTLGNNLKWSDVLIQTNSEGEGFGDITVGAAVTRGYDSEAAPTQTLTLAADRSVILRADISGSAGAALNIVVAARARGGASGSIQVGASLRSFGGDITLGGGDTSASGYAIGLGGNVGLYMYQNKNIDATGDGSTLSSGAGERTAVIPSSSTGGNIVIRAQGWASAQYYGCGFMAASNNSIVTAGNGSITIKGYGGNSNHSGTTAEGSSAGIFLGSGTYIKAKGGNIILEGYKGTGYESLGIIANSSSPSFIGTSSGISILGDSLALLGGEVRLYSNSASTISAPVVGGNTGSTSYTLTKTGEGSPEHGLEQRVREHACVHLLTLRRQFGRQRRHGRPSFRHSALDRGPHGDLQRRKLQPHLLRRNCAGQ